MEIKAIVGKTAYSYTGLSDSPDKETLAVIKAKLLNSIVSQITGYYSKQEFEQYGRYASPLSGRKDDGYDEEKQKKFEEIYKAIDLSQFIV